MAQRMQFSPEDALKEMAQYNQRVANGLKLLAKVKDEDIKIATTPKEEVFRQDKMTLSRYVPLAQNTVKVPVLMVYGLIGRWTMADLQEDRSLVRNLLKQGVDVYVVDWGNPDRSDRYVGLEDYVDGYLDECVEFIRAQHGIDKVNLLGICEGGVFTLSYAALYPDRVKNMAITITPVDFHAETDRIEHGYISVWTRSLEPEDI